VAAGARVHGTADWGVTRPFVERAHRRRCRGPGHAYDRSVTATTDPAGGSDDAALVPPSDPVAAPPARRRGSVRRTSTMLMTWPEGTDLHLTGRARDLLTPREGTPVVVSQSELRVVTGRARDIRSIAADPAPAGLQRLVGCRAGGSYRAALARELPDEIAGGTPLSLLLDDVAGSTLISGFVFVRWSDHIPQIKERLESGPRPMMRGVCSGFREGARSINSDGTLSGLRQNTAVPGPLVDPADPLGWHAVDPHPEMAMRRARRIDVWQEDGLLGIDAMFRDSCWDPDGTEAVVHEYQITGRADPATGALVSVQAQPRVLPYGECQGAAPNASWMVGTELREMRTKVLERLRAADCCTHLNDGLRSLAEVPVLAASLPA
jgi:hypothetical protein